MRTKRRKQEWKNIDGKKRDRKRKMRGDNRTKRKPGATITKINRKKG